MLQRSSAVVMRNNIPVPIQTPLADNKTITETLRQQWSKPFVPRHDPDTGEILPEDLPFVGKSAGDAQAARVNDMAAYGDMQALQFVWDRLLGKPKQQVESVSVSMTVREYLDALPAPTEQELKAIEGKAPPMVHDILQ